MAQGKLTERQKDVLEVIEKAQRERGYPPSVREIGEVVGLASPSTVHNHLKALERLGYITRDPTKPRAIEIHYDSVTGSIADRRPVKHIPLVGDVAAGVNVLAQENVEELVPVPADLTGDGDLFMLRVRGESMIEVGIFDGDFIVARKQEIARDNDIVVIGIPGEEATVKTYIQKGNMVTLLPANPTMEPMHFPIDEVHLYGRVVTVMRRL